MGSADSAQDALSTLGPSAGRSAEPDSDVRVLRDLARNVLLPFATLEWLSLAPDIVAGSEDVVRQLGPGVSIGEAFPGVFSTLPAVEILGAASSPSQSSASSPSSQPPPVSRTPSSGSAVTDPRPPPATRSTRPLPRTTYRRPREASPPSTATIRPVASIRRAPVAAASPVAAVPPAVESPAAESSRSVKRKVSGEEPMDTRPASWLTCALCKKKKHLCRPPKGSKPPFASCTACLHDGVICVPAPAEESAVARV
jgi:hypothetical protein